MVCIYCGSPTSVNNSRLQHSNNHVWRRRCCTECGSIFTTIELPDLSGTFMVNTGADGGKRSLKPFSRDKLFLDIYACCKHRPKAIDEAASLTQTVINQLLAQKPEGIVDRAEIVTKTYNALKRFDAASATIFAAYHKVADAPAAPSPTS